MQALGVFVSYSHDSQPHKDWVHAFSSDLILNGVDVTLDQWDLRPGQDIVSFMHRSLARADRVILICTSNYAQKAELGQGGVGYEKLIVGAEIAAKTNTAKFIPIVRNNDTRTLPSFLGARLYLDFSTDAEYPTRLNELLHELHGIPLRPKPKLGAFAVPQLVGTEDKPTVRPALTPRELDALRWTMEGKSAWEVAAILGVSERTSSLDLANAMQKLEATNKHQAVLRALREGILK